MMPAPRRRTAGDVLRSLSALGARVECRGDKIVLRVGARPVPPHLIAAAREAKVELSKMLNSPKMLNTGDGEHLRRAAAENTRFSEAPIEGAQPRESDHLRAGRSAFRGRRGSPPVPGDAAAKALTEDAHLSAFDRGEDSSGSRRDPTSKALNPAKVSTFGQDERLQVHWSEDEEERTASAAPELFAPAAWFERSVQPAPSEPPFDQPCATRRGRVERRGPALLHFCVECGAWGAFGYSVTGGSLGRWYCRDHRPGSAP